MPANWNGSNKAFTGGEKLGMMNGLKFKRWFLKAFFAYTPLRFSMN
jgi:hypothetical protein